ncbi:MAG: hypothetical protein NVSMB27_25170 [Ktedonobacteraceae bacterium]
MRSHVNLSTRRAAFVQMRASVAFWYSGELVLVSMGQVYSRGGVVGSEDYHELEMTFVMWVN